MTAENSSDGDAHRSRGSDVTGVVLAGGESSRFEDGHKALATLDDEYLLARVVDAVSAATTPDPVVVLRDEAQRDLLSPALSDRPTRVAFDDPAFSGPLAGLFGAVEHVETRWLFCCGCDMPLLSPAAILSLVDRRNAEDAVVPVHDDRPEPLHALYRRSVLPGVAAEISPQAGVHSLLDHLTATTTVLVERVPGETDLGASTTNVNTTAELERTRRKTAGDVDPLGVAVPRHEYVREGRQVPGDRSDRR